MNIGSMMDMDAVVIGGGPAGSLTARGLAMRGWRTMLIESCLRNRAKTCGHCLNPRAMRILDDHGLLESVRAIAVGSTGHLRVYGLGASLMMPLSNDQLGGQPHTGLLTPRHMLDQVLIDAAGRAGVEVMQPASAKVLRGQDNRLIVVVQNAGLPRTIRPRLIIGADGLGSAVARSVGLCHGASIGRKFGFSFECNGTMSTDEAFFTSSVNMIVMPDGYLGVVRQHDGTLHCAGLVAMNTPESSREPLIFAKRAMMQLKQDKRVIDLRCDSEEVRHFVATGPMPWRPTSVANVQVALVGDAAGYIEPFTGEGMSWAMESATLLLATVADAAPGTWNQSMAGQYQREWRRTIGRRQRACMAVAYTLARPRLFRLTMSIARRHPIVSRRMVKWVHS